MTYLLRCTFWMSSTVALFRFVWLVCRLYLQVIINFNALPWLLNLLSSSKKGIRKEACWTISNITAGNKEQIQAVIEANIIPPLIQLLSNAEFDIRKVRGRANCNCCSLETGEVS